MTEWMSSLLNADWIRQVIEMILFVLMSLVYIIVLPFSLVIDRFFPSLAGVLDAINNLIDLALTYVNWVLNALAIPSAVISLVLAYWVFVITTSLYVWGGKLAVKWVAGLFK